MNIKVFVSSTIFDLIDIRAELEVLLREMGASPILSDSTTSEFIVCPNKNSIESCLVNVRAADIVLVILSQRYGPSLKSAGFDDVSATHLEYREAQAQNIPVYVYVRDRLESDYRIWRKNRGTVDLTWVENASNSNLFELIEEHQKLVKSASKSNWYMTFRDSIELKNLVRRDLSLPAAKASLERAIRDNVIPIFHGEIEVKVNTPVPGKCYVTYTCRNVGRVPAYNIRILWSDKPGESFNATPIVAPTCEVFQNSIIELPGGDREMFLEYQTPEGHVVIDVFSTAVKVGNNAISRRMVLADRRYKPGTGVPFKID